MSKQGRARRTPDERVYARIERRETVQQRRAWEEQQREAAQREIAASGGLFWSRLGAGALPTIH